MANEFVTNRKVELIAFRAAEAANYLRIGSRKYFKDQLVGKRNGRSYDFVLRDAGAFVEGEDLTAQGITPSELHERKVTKSLEIGNVVIATKLLEPVVEANWDDDVAMIQGPKLIHGVVRKTVNADIGLQNTAFVGSGFQPMFKAQNFLKTVSDAPIYGFTNPFVNAVLSSNGQSFQPAEAGDVFSKAGLQGKLGDVEYRANQYMPMVSVDSALDTEVKKLTAITYADVDDVNATLTLSGVNAVIPKGYVIWIKDTYAADIVGDKTGALKAFIAYEDGTTDGTDAVMKIRKVHFSGEGTKEVTKADGSAYGANQTAAITAFNTAHASITSANVDLLPVGDFYCGMCRIDGAMEFETVDKLDASNADTKTETVEGLTVIENRAVDVMAGKNDTRWTVVSLSGIVDPREVAMFYVKDKVINVVTTNA